MGIKSISTMIDILSARILAEFGEDSVEVISTGLQPTLLVKREILSDLCLWLRDHHEYYFDFLANITAVDYYPENRFALIYNLSSIPFQLQLTLKVLLDNSRDENDLPEVDTVSTVWRTADWHEREAFDLMGIYFIGHSDLRRILLPDDWVGFPLRKDYTEAESYHGISLKS